MGDDRHVVGLDGATVIPGLIDTHPHLMGFALVAEPLVDLADAVDHHDIGTRIAAKAAETPPGEWVMTTPVGEAHYFLRRSYRDLTEGEIPDRRVLDRAAPDHPVFVQRGHRSRRTSARSTARPWTCSASITPHPTG